MPKSQLSKRDRQAMMFEAFVYALLAAVRILQFAGHPYGEHFLSQLVPILESAQNLLASAMENKTNL